MNTLYSWFFSLGMGIGKHTSEKAWDWSQITGMRVRKQDMTFIVMYDIIYKYTLMENQPLFFGGFIALGPRSYRSVNN